MLVAFLAYKDQFSARIATMLDTFVRLMLLGLHSERVADIALAEPEKAVGPIATIIPGDDVAFPCRGAALNARAITFRYGDNEGQIIADYDFDVAPGEWWRSSVRPVLEKPHCSSYSRDCCSRAAALCCLTKCPSRQSG